MVVAIRILYLLPFSLSFPRSEHKEEAIKGIKMRLELLLDSNSKNVSVIKAFKSVIAQRVRKGPFFDHLAQIHANKNSFFSGIRQRYLILTSKKNCAKNVFSRFANSNREKRFRPWTRFSVVKKFGWATRQTQVKWPGRWVDREKVVTKNNKLESAFTYSNLLLYGVSRACLNYRTTNKKKSFPHPTYRDASSISMQKMWVSRWRIFRVRCTKIKTKTATRRKKRLQSFAERNAENNDQNVDFLSSHLFFFSA